MAKKKTISSKKNAKPAKKKPSKKEFENLCNGLQGSPLEFGEWVDTATARTAHNNWFRRTYGRYPNPKSVKAIAFGRKKLEILLNDRFPQCEGIRLYFCDRKVDNKKYTDVFFVPIDNQGKDMISLKKPLQGDEVLNTSMLCPTYCFVNYGL